MPTVSVIVPAFNSAAYLGQALDSVAGQSFRDFECIVVDDGSTDETPALLAARAGIRTIRQENAGPSAARNAGMHTARGEFLTFLDADNVWFPDKLAVQVGFHRQHPEIDFSYVRIEEWLEDGVEEPEWTLRHRSSVEFRRFNPCGLMIRRLTMEQIGGFNPGFRLGENAEWLSRARDAGLRSAQLPQVLGRQRIHRTNLTHDRAGMRRHVLLAMRESIHRKRQAGAVADPHRREP